MDVKRLTLLSLLVLISACTTSSTGIANQEKLYFSNYALAIFLGSSFKDEDVKSDLRIKR